MKLATFLFTLIASAAIAQEPPALPWMTDLDAAFKKADKEGKLVFYRQITCGCETPEKCPYAGIASRPGFLADAEIRARLKEKFILVACRRPKEIELIDLASDAAETPERPIRSFFLTPSRHVLHSLDACPLSADFDSEIDYALMLRLVCFGRNWETDSDTASNLKQHRRDHRESPREYHSRKTTGQPALECGCPPVDSGSPSRRPWSGYASGVAWHTDLDEARVLAEHTKRPLLYWQVVGDLNKEGC